MDSEDESPPLIQQCDLVQIRIKGVDEEDVIVTSCSVPTICPPPQAKPVEFYKDEFRHLANLELADEIVEKPFRENNIDIMIGLDFYYSFVFDETRRGVCGPVATKSRLGWLVAGPIFSNSSSNLQSINQQSTTALVTMDDNV